jgi:hypothetical protein
MGLVTMMAGFCSALLAGVSAKAGDSIVDARMAASAGTWGKVHTVPGLAALSGGGDSQILSVSCRSVGNCSGGGFYEAVSGATQAFAVSETNGTWGKAKEVPSSGTLNTGGNAQVGAVSCGSAGNCSGGGFYEQLSGHIQAFVVSQSKGIWGKAKEVPGSAVLNAGGYAQVLSVSCVSAGSCSAGGFYSKASNNVQAFVVNESSGTWGTAEQVPGSAALNVDGAAEIDSVSCASAGSCSAAGT